MHAMHSVSGAHHRACRDRILDRDARVSRSSATSSNFFETTDRTGDEQ